MSFFGRKKPSGKPAVARGGSPAPAPVRPAAGGVSSNQKTASQTQEAPVAPPQGQGRAQKAPPAAKVTAPQAAPPPREELPRDGAQRVLRHADDAVATILMRDAYTKERHFFLLRLILAMVAVIIAETWVISFLAMRQPVYKYFATDRDGRIQPITPIDQPIGSEAEVSNWVANAVVRAYTFDFANWRSQLSAARENFTPQGWKGFEAALKDSGVLQTVLEKKYVTTAVPTGAPVLINQGMVEGHYAWRFQMPLLVTYQSSEKTVPQNLMVNIFVVRQSEMVNPRGLGIAQLIAQ